MLQPRGSRAADDLCCQNLSLSCGEMSFWSYLGLMVEDDADAKSEACSLLLLWS